MRQANRAGVSAAAVLMAGVLAILSASCSSDSESAGSDTTAATAASATSATSASNPVDVSTTDATAPAASATDVTPESGTEATAGPTTEQEAPSSTGDELPSLTEADASTSAALQAAFTATPEGCDPLDGRACLYPFPSNEYTVADPATDSGLRVRMPAGAVVANASGVPVDLAEWNRNDGFSPNSTLLTLVPGIDAVQSHLPPWTDLEQSLAEDATVVLIDTETGERVPLWAELDVKATAAEDRSLVVHPAIALPEGHHFVVALRGLRNAAGTAIEPGAVFRAYRDRLTAPDADQRFEQRRATMETTFAALADAGVERGALYLAWDFTVASERSTSERMLSIRDQALDALGDAAPTFTLESITPGEAGNDIGFQVLGTFTVPNFLTGDGGPGESFDYAADGGPDGLPQQNGTLEAGFVCNVSAATIASAEPAHLVQYGHGLLGSNLEINAGNVVAFANESNVVFCATKWAGMSEDDVPNAAFTLGELGNFDTVADRLQQGVLNQIFLGRLMTREGGLSSLPELTRADGTSMIDTSHLDYDGNSQGGIMGIMLAAVSPDIERATLGVPGINYSLLLPRSVDFATYEAVMTPAYPNELDRLLGINLLQMLWDRGEGGGYVQHLVDDPYERTPAKTVLLDVAFGDWQVTELSAMVAVRTMGIPIRRPVTAGGRSEEVEPGWGLDTLEFPSDSSGIIIWDSGADPIPLDGIAPSTGYDPHEHPRRDPDVREQKASFLFEDTLVDVCEPDAACTADRND